MKYSEFLNIIYSSNLEDIIRILNQSIYASDYDYNNSIVIHSGFYFQTHKNNQIELLFDLDHEIIIRQTIKDFNTLPIINGLIVVKQNDYFSSNIKYILLAIDKEDNNKRYIYEIKDQNSIQNKYHIAEYTIVTEDGTDQIITTFSITQNDQGIKEFPLNKELDEIMFFNGSAFKRHISDAEYYSREDDYNSSDYEEEKYGKYGGTYAQDVEGLSDNFIDNVLGGDPDAYWNID